MKSTGAHREAFALRGVIGSKPYKSCAIAHKLHVCLPLNQYQLLDFIQGQVLDRKQLVEWQCRKIQERYGGFNSF